MTQQQKSKSKGRKVGRSKRGKPYSYERNHVRRLLRRKKREAVFRARRSARRHIQSLKNTERELAVRNLTGCIANNFTLEYKLASAAILSHPYPIIGTPGNIFRGDLRWYTRK